MAIFWLILGAIVGFAIAWYFLNRQCEAQLADRDRDIAKLELELATSKANQQPSAQSITDDPDMGPVGFASLDVESVDETRIANPDNAGSESADQQSDLPESEVPESDLPESEVPEISVPDPGDLGDAELAELGRPASPLNADSLNVSADDLTRIKGIGPVLKQKLSGLGIVTFRQIADFTPADIERVNAELDFPGRIERENWVEQAKGFVEPRPDA
jgi:predicted flap endonuclease-1-like 5' DNA nuclease